MSPDFTYGGTFQNASGTPTAIGTFVNGAVVTNSDVIAILMDYATFPLTGGSTINTNHQSNPQGTKFLNAKMSGWVPPATPSTETPLGGVDQQSRVPRPVGQSLPHQHGSEL